MKQWMGYRMCNLMDHVNGDEHNGSNNALSNAWKIARISYVNCATKDFLLMFHD